MAVCLPAKVAPVAPDIDEDFLALPLRTLTDAALAIADVQGCEHADVRVMRTRQRVASTRDGRVENTGADEALAMAVRVVHRGAWGFAATDHLTPESAARLAERAIELAEVSAPMATSPIVLASTPQVGTVDRPERWVSAYDVDPWELTDVERAVPLLEWSDRLLAAGVDHVDASCEAVRENTYYADLAGSATVQQRIRIQPNLTAVRIARDTGDFEDMSTTAPPTARGWEYLTGTGWNWDAEIAEIPDWLSEKMAAPSVEPGRYDLVIDPTNLWLTIHESIGHATELDRALGYEANYAGTSFVTPDQLGNLRYGTEHLCVTGDRTTPHGLATVGWDDESVAAGSWDIIRDGVFVGYQLDRAMAGATGRASNGCAYADSALHVPIQRMPNVSLEADPTGPTTNELISSVDDGLYVVGDKSWSIDMQRYNFQFTGQRFYRIRDGRIVSQVRDVAYQSNTVDFWSSMTARGGPSTYLLGGAFNCGKGQPGQIAPVSHGTPSALFRSINVLNTVAEAGR